MYLIKYSKSPFYQIIYFVNGKRTYGLKLGRVAYEAASQNLLGDKEKLKELFL
ncbi:MAG: hypothetical protein MUE93_04090 [Ignavibacteriaceae bacterium]|nr:hypothetical protein [Ignavibacteriaceae bacterium]